MDQASPQCMDDDSSLSAYRPDERLPKVVVHFSVVRGATLAWRVDADSTLSVQGAPMAHARQLALRSSARFRTAEKQTPLQ